MLFLLAAPPLLADQGRELRHRQGEIWMSCDPSVPVMDVGGAFIDAAVRQHRTGQSCLVKQQEKRFLVFRHVRKLEYKKPKR